MNALPNTSLACSIVMREPSLRYWTMVAVNTAFRNEIDHMEFHFQNWLDGTRAAIDAHISPQLDRVGVMASSKAGTDVQ